jgi:HEPN domain-containing protein
MMPEHKTRKVNRRDAYPFVEKAEQFLRAMEKAVEVSDWDAAGLNAVHSVISAADAVTAFRAGIRSAEQDHKMLADVLEDIVGEGAGKSVRHLKAVLAKKNTIEYEQRKLTPKEAADIAEHARRFVSWAREELPES